MDTEGHSGGKTGNVEGGTIGRRIGVGKGWRGVHKARGVLSREDGDKLAGEKSNADKIRKCLDIVEGKGEESVKIFLNILHLLLGSYPPGSGFRPELKSNRLVLVT
uniref:CARD domain-containing protein n=1 Tax=Eptatretus burgeri TaxID=7764 RepID=A0A8C4NL43_EPTBU